MANNPYYSSSPCAGFALQQALIIPGSPQLTFVLNPDDISMSPVDAGKTLSIKYEAFSRDIKAVFQQYSVTLTDVTALEYRQIINFAKQDFLSKVRTTGRGSLTLYHRGIAYNNLYIETPINPGKSFFKNWQAQPTEVYESLELTIVNPSPTWF